MTRSRFLRYLALSGLGIGALALPGCRPGDPAAEARAELADSARTEADKKLIRMRRIDAPPELTGTTLDGKPISLKQFRGEKVVLLNFYANF